MRPLEKADLIGKRIIDVIVSMPDKPVTMASQSYSRGFLRFDSGALINLGSYAPPLLACSEEDLRCIMRDTNYEREFGPVIGQEVIAVIFPDENEQGEVQVSTANGFVMASVASCFWIRPCIERKKS